MATSKYRNNIKAKNKRPKSNKATGRDYARPVEHMRGILKDQWGDNNVSYKHGMYNSPEYRSWRSMKGRCLNESDPAYKNYGGRGIQVCERWLDFESFYEDMGSRPEGTTLDRVDVNGNYEPSNCRWATPIEQSKHKRGYGKVEYRGIDIYNNKYRVTYKRKHLGYFTLLKDAVAKLESVQKGYAYGK